jgi:hypothetical protein
MRECWININYNYQCGNAWNSRENAISAAMNAARHGFKTIYRIHVRLK